MKDFGWEDKYLLGIPAIDLQHKRIFDCLKIIAGGSTRHDRSLAEFAIVRLPTLLQQHAALEESMMRSFSYPELEPHIEEHRQFHADVHDWAQLSLRTNEPISLAVIKAFHERQREHIMTTDRHYVEYLLGPPRKGGGRKPGGGDLANGGTGAPTARKSAWRGQSGHRESHVESV